MADLVLQLIYGTLALIAARIVLGILAGKRRRRRGLI